MAKCDICNKGVTFGIQVSHSHRRSNRTWVYLRIRIIMVIIRPTF